MKHLFLTLTAAITLATACTPGAKQKSGNTDGAVDPNLKTKVVFAFPDLSSLKAGDKAASEVMTDYLFTITEVQGSCVGVDAKTHRVQNLVQVDTISSAYLAATISANCDYQVQLSLGQGRLVHGDTELALDATAAQATYHKNVKSIVNAKCISCHSGASASAGVDLSSETSVKQYKSSIVSTINGGYPVMPPNGSTKLTSAEKNTFNAWKSNNYAMGDDTPTATSPSSDTASSDSSSDASLEKVFYWNKTPLTLNKTDLQKYKTFSTVLELKLTTQGKAIGFTTPTLKTIKEKLESNSTSNTDTNTEDERDPDTNTNNDTGSGTNTGTKVAVSYKDVQSLIQSKCVNCHPGQGRSDLSSYAKFKARGTSSVDQILSDTMPRGDRLTAAQKDLFKKWRDAGFPETASADAGTSTAPDGTVEFRIAAGTGNKAWNSPNAPLKLKVGQKLKIINDDSTAHWLHTDGAPCDHGNSMPAGGGSYTCVLSRTFSGELHDHLYDSSGFFYIEVSK